MRHQLRSLSLVFFLATPVFAGEPVEDVDVTVEQVPGASFNFESPGGGFDRVRIRGDRAFIAGLAPETLPPGWTMTREGKEVVLSSATAAAGPVRFRLTMERRVTQTVDWDVSIAGKTLAGKKGVVPRTVPQRKLIGSLQGLVQMPPEVSPGETVAVKVLDPEKLPPGGRWSLSGVVLDEVPPEEQNPEGLAALARLNKTKDIIRNMKARGRGVELELPEGRPCVEAAGTTSPDSAPCAGLAASALLLGLTGDEGGTVVARMQAQQRPQGGRGGPEEKTEKPPQTFAFTPIDAAAQPAHDVAKGSIRNLRFADLESLVTSGDGAQGISIKEQGIEISIKEKGIEISIKEEGIKFWELAGPGGTESFGLVEVPAGAWSDEATGRAVEVGLTLTPEASGEGAGIAYHSLNTTRSNIKGIAAKAADLLVAYLPDALAAGDTLSMVYTDLYGDVLVDVPAVPGTQVVPPRPEDPTPRLTSAPRHVLVGDPFCVCGNFPSPEAWYGLRFDDQTTPAFSTASSRSVWFQLPTELAPGRHFVGGVPAAGYTPGSRVETEVLEVRGSLDSTKLLSGQSTPMRLQVIGTRDPIKLRIRNLTPAGIELEGGADQMAETSGGDENVLTRSVRGLQPGVFDVRWTLASDPCPCGQN